MGARKSKAIFLKQYPAGLPADGDFTEKEIDVPAPGAGEMLCRTVWMSVDPYMRGRMRPDVNTGTDDRQICLPFGIHGTEQIGAFKARQ